MSKWFAIVKVDKAAGDLIHARFFRTPELFVDAAAKGDYFARIEPFDHRDTAHVIQHLRTLVNAGALERV